MFSGHVQNRQHRERESGHEQGHYKGAEREIGREREKSACMQGYYTERARERRKRVHVCDCITEKREREKPVKDNTIWSSQPCSPQSSSENKSTKKAK